MSDAWQSIKVSQFEHVPSGAATSLLRVSGRSPWRRAASARPKLRVDRNGEAHRFAALPAPDDPRGSLRAAYSVPTVLIVADSKYWLEHADGSLTDLPMPETGPGRSATDPAAAAGSATDPGRTAPDPAEARTSTPRDPDPDELPDTERRSDLLAKLAEQSRQLAGAEREAAEHEQARRLAETELVRAREALKEHATEQEDSAHPGTTVLERELERATKLEAENDQLRDTLRELEVWRGELERRLTAMSTELGVAKAAREADERELQRLREALTEAQAGGDGEGQSADASQTLAAQAAEIELLVAELASLRAERSGAETPAPEGLSDRTSARIARLEAQRAELADRAERLSAALQEALAPAQALVELARSGHEHRSATSDDGAADAELISRSAERSAREQAERELREATHEYSQGGAPAG